MRKYALMFALLSCQVMQITKSGFDIQDVKMLAEGTYTGGRSYYENYNYLGRLAHLWYYEFANQFSRFINLANVVHDDESRSLKEKIDSEMRAFMNNPPAGINDWAERTPTIRPTMTALLNFVYDSRGKISSREIINELLDIYKKIFYEIPQSEYLGYETIAQKMANTKTANTQLIIPTVAELRVLAEGKVPKAAPSSAAASAGASSATAPVSTTGVTPAHRIPAVVVKEVPKDLNQQLKECQEQLAASQAENARLKRQIRNQY